MATGGVVGVEALLRWQHPRRGLLPPEKFIDVAEDSGSSCPSVPESACAQLAAWQRALKPGLRISVNLSVGQMYASASLASRRGARAVAPQAP